LEAPEKERPFINKILTGDVITQLRLLPDEFVQMVVTSPPYWGPRDYLGEQEVTWPDGTKSIYGHEPTIELYVEHTILILRAIRRVLRSDGVLFWNVGDSYASGGKCGEGEARSVSAVLAQKYASPSLDCQRRAPISPGLKPTDMNMIPFRVALAAHADGWYVRCDIIWSKPNPMPESVTKRPTKSHEYIFQLTKSNDYFWDQEAVREKAVTKEWPGIGPKHGDERDRGEEYKPMDANSGRNIRSVWTFATGSYEGAHCAVFPEELPRRCILAATSERGRCPTCGAPWARVVERKNPSKKSFVPDHISSSGPPGSIRSMQSIPSLHRNTSPDGKSSGVYSKAKTVGWEPTCDCYGVGHLPKYPAQEDEEMDEAYEERIAPIRERRAAILKTYEFLSTIPCVVLDTFMGAGTTALVALDNNRQFVGIEISAEYVKMAYDRIKTPAKNLKLEDFL
jgi:DNA modification methylase